MVNNGVISPQNSVEGGGRLKLWGGNYYITSILISDNYTLRDNIQPLLNSWSRTNASSIIISDDAAPKIVASDFGGKPNIAENKKRQRMQDELLEKESEHEYTCKKHDRGIFGIVSQLLGIG
jgi:hypothetical protein